MATRRDVLVLFLVLFVDLFHFVDLCFFLSVSLYLYSIYNSLTEEREGRRKGGGVFVITPQPQPGHGLG